MRSSNSFEKNKDCLNNVQVAAPSSNCIKSVNKLDRLKEFTEGDENS